VGERESGTVGEERRTVRQEESGTGVRWEVGEWENWRVKEKSGTLGG
jgi:hypothetical protein